MILFDWRYRETRRNKEESPKIKNLYFTNKIPVEKLMPKIENKTAKQEEHQAVAKIAEKIPDKAPKIPVGVDFISKDLTLIE